MTDFSTEGSATAVSPAPCVLGCILILAVMLLHTLTAAAFPEPPRMQSHPPSEIQLNELLANPHDLPAGDQNCDGDLFPGEDGNNQDNAADEFVELRNQTLLTISLGGLCLANQPLTAGNAAPGNNYQWMIPWGTMLPPEGIYAVCGRTDADGNGTGFSQPDLLGNQIRGFSNSGGWVGLYEPTIAGNCASGVAEVIFSFQYPDGESNGQSWQQCDGILSYYDPQAEFAPTLARSNDCPVPSAISLSLMTAQNNGRFNQLLIFIAMSALALLTGLVLRLLD